MCLVRHFRALHPFVIVGSFVFPSGVGGVAAMETRDRGLTQRRPLGRYLSHKMGAVAPYRECMI